MLKCILNKGFHNIFPFPSRLSGIIICGSVVLLLFVVGCSSVNSVNYQTADQKTKIQTDKSVQTPSQPEVKDEEMLLESPLLLPDVLAFASESNPSLKASESRWSASKEMPVQARTLNDPMLSAQYMTDSAMNKTGVMLSQKIPWFGKLNLRGEIAEADVLIAEQRHINEKWHLIGKVKMAYYDLFWFNQAIRVNEEVKSIISNIEKIAQLQYSTGKVSQQDVLKTQMEFARISNEVSILKQNQTSAKAKLNQLLNRPVSAILGEPEMTAIAPIKFSLEKLIQLALEYSPELKIVEQEIQKARREESLARKQFYPDWVISAEYNNKVNSNLSNSDNEWGGQVGINLPLWREKYNAAVRQAQSNQNASQHNYESVVNYTAFEMKEGYVKVTNAWQVIELYRTTLIPQAEQTLAVSQIAYQAGKSDFTALLDSVTMLLDLKLGLYKAQVNYKKELAMLELCCAFPVENITDDSIGIIDPEPKQTGVKIGQKVKCPVTGAEITVAEDTSSLEYKGKFYYFCCDNCNAVFNKNPEKYIKKSE